MHYQINRKILKLRHRFEITEAKGPTITSEASGPPILIADKHYSLFSIRYSIRSSEGHNELFTMRSRIELGLPKYELSQGGLSIGEVRQPLSYRKEYQVKLNTGEKLLVDGGFGNQLYHAYHSDEEEMPVAFFAHHPVKWRRQIHVAIFEPRYATCAFALAILMLDKHF